MGGVVTHLDPVLIVKRAGFVEDSVGDAQLSDIVEQRAAMEPAEPQSRNVHLSSDGSGQFGDPCRMSGGEGAFRINDLAECCGDIVEEIVIYALDRVARRKVARRASRKGEARADQNDLSLRPWRRQLLVRDQSNCQNDAKLRQWRHSRLHGRERRRQSGLVRRFGMRQGLSSLQDGWAGHCRPNVRRGGRCLRRPAPKSVIAVRCRRRECSAKQSIPARSNRHF